MHVNCTQERKTDSVQYDRRFKNIILYIEQEKASGKDRERFAVRDPGILLLGTREQCPL